MHNDIQFVAEQDIGNGLLDACNHHLVYLWRPTAVNGAVDQRQSGNDYNIRQYLPIVLGRYVVLEFVNQGILFSSNTCFFWWRYPVNVRAESPAMVMVSRNSGL